MINDGIILTNVVSIAYLLGIAAAFVFIVAGILLFIVYYLNKRRRISRTKKHLRGLYADLISEISLCQTDEELEEVLKLPYIQTIIKKCLCRKLGREVLIKELVKSKDNLTGDAAQNLRWLYEKLGLNEDSYARFASPHWHRKASGIQQLAEMQQTRYLLKIYRETNSKNPFVRTEAQIAVVKLTGFKGLRFLHVIGYPITQWQQLCLINQLKEQEVETESISGWLTSANESVVQFALRLVEVYKCFSLHDQVAQCLHHPSVAIRQQALRALKEIASDVTVPFLQPLFHQCSRQEQVLMIDILLETVDPEGIAFLKTLLLHDDELIRHKVEFGLNGIIPATWQSAEDDESEATFIIPSPQKQAV